jgi:hypothetical protein
MVREYKRIFGLLLALAAAAGCGDGGGGGGSSAVAPSLEVQQASQSADAAGQAQEQTVEIATDAVVESGAPGSTSQKTGGPVSTGPSATFNFQASVSVTVDLDALNASGQDKYPNATGRFTVNATGSVVGTNLAGQADYTCQVQWITDGVFTDPVCGASATIAAGSQRSYTLHVEWSWTDDFNWSVQARSDLNGQAQGSVTNGSQTWTFTGTVERHATASFSRTAGTWSFAFSIAGERTLVITSGSVTHTVVIQVLDLDRILITVDGVTFGPLTWIQVRILFGFDCRA